MIRLTKKLLFAIEAVLDIAYNGGAGAGALVRDHRAPGHPAPLSRTGAAGAGARRHPCRHPRARAAAIAWPASGGASALATSSARCGSSRPREDPISDPAGSALGHQVVRPLWLDLGRDDAAARRADPRGSLRPGAPRRHRRPHHRRRRFRDLSGSAECATIGATSSRAGET